MIIMIIIKKRILDYIFFHFYLIYTSLFKYSMNFQQQLYMKFLSFSIDINEIFQCQLTYTFTYALMITFMFLINRHTC